MTTTTTTASAPRPMKIYVDGLQHAERLRQQPLLEQDPVANAYSHGYFAALDDVLKPLVGHMPGSCEEKLWKLVLEIHAAAVNPTEREGG
jgi:hypothetical protein